MLAINAHNFMFTKTLFYPLQETQMNESSWSRRGIGALELIIQ
ncbi:MAG: hypothetical protein DHS20C20_17810 [Ardenticatenaceae bacterium]|nr:MAG: hypothetical protein DHS20C20_17810 [Ardenticatenaceae bacterium]